jgi:hypothetical protein
MEPKTDPLATTALNLPEIAPRDWDWAAMKLTWEQVMDATEAQRAYFMEHFYTDEYRIRMRSPNPEPFRMP